MDPRGFFQFTADGRGYSDWPLVFKFVVALLRNSRKTECGAGQFLVRLAVRAAPFALLRNFAQNGARRGPVPGPFGGARRTLCASKELRAKRSAARAGSWSVLRCAPHPLRFLPVAVRNGCFEILGTRVWKARREPSGSMAA